MLPWPAADPEMTAASRDSRQSRSLCVVLGVAGALAGTLGLLGYRLPFEDRIVMKRVALYQEWEGMLDSAGKVVGRIEPGTSCQRFQVAEKSILNFRVRCGDWIGWTAESHSFSPPL